MAAGVGGGFGIRVTPSDLRIGEFADAYAQQNAQETAEMEDLQVNAAQLQSQLDGMRADIRRIEEQYLAKDTDLQNFQVSISQWHSENPAVQKHIEVLKQGVAERRAQVHEALQQLKKHHVQSILTQVQISQIHQGVHSLDQRQQAAVAARAAGLEELIQHLSQ